MSQIQRILNALFILVISGVLISAYVYQFVKMEQPCPLCMLQRLALMGVTMGPLFNLVFGIRMENYALSIASAIFGGSVSLRQISLHVCPQFATFGEPVLGFDLYAWCLFVFTSSIFAVALLLFLYGISKEKEIKPQPSTLKTIAIIAISLIILGNVVTTLMECGMGACIG